MGSGSGSLSLVVEGILRVDDKCGDCLFAGSLSDLVNTEFRQFDSVLQKIRIQGAIVVEVRDGEA